MRTYIFIIYKITWHVSIDHGFPYFFLLNFFFFQVHKIIGFAPVLLQVVMTGEIDMPVRQAGIMTFLFSYNTESVHFS